MTRKAVCDNRRQMYFFFSTIARVFGRWPSGTVVSGTDLRELSSGSHSRSQMKMIVCRVEKGLFGGKSASRHQKGSVQLGGSNRSADLSSSNLERRISCPRCRLSGGNSASRHRKTPPQLAGSLFGTTMSPRKLRQAISARICHPATCGGKFRVRDAVCPMGNLHFHGRDADSPPNNGISVAETVARIFLFTLLAGFIQKQTPNDLSGGRLGFDAYARFLLSQEDSLSPFLLVELYL